MGIRLFNTREALHQIFEEFEPSDSDDEQDDSSKTAVIASQLRHFVIQVEMQQRSSTSYLIFDYRNIYCRLCFLIRAKLQSTIGVRPPILVCRDIKSVSFHILHLLVRRVTI